MNVIDWLLDGDPAIRWPVQELTARRAPPAVGAGGSPRVTTGGTRRGTAGC